MDPESPSDGFAEMFACKREWHRAQAQLPVKEKVRILLQLQRQELPLIERQRPLRYCERPWDIEP